ncbi:MAG: cell envelope integrity protein CreD [Flavobacteriales bacterium]
MSQDKSFLDRINSWVKTSISLKIFTIVFLILILLIPINMVERLINEREWNQKQAIEEVSSTWGNDQTITAIVLTVPYMIYSTIEGKDDEPDKILEAKKYAHFLPVDLTISGDLNPERRKRGIYEVVLYSSELEISGAFEKPDFKKLNINEEHVKWSQAYIELGISDLRSIQNEVAINWHGQQVAFDPGIKNSDVISSGISANVFTSDSVKKYNFNLTLDFNGSDQIQFTPLGKTTNVSLASSWPDPKFNGSFLPDSREVTETGFSADWEVLHLNRNYPQEFIGAMNKSANSNFGVELMMPVDHYAKSMRSVKYALLFISLTFLIYFFTQIKNRIRIHPLQYLMVGLAICLFFTLLIALSEHMSFDLAYLIGAAGTIGMITAYSFFIFKNKLLTGVLAGVLIILYGFIYIILQMQNFSLLIGSIGLFFILGTVMYMSRNIDWYTVSKDSDEST